MRLLRVVQASGRPVLSLLPENIAAPGMRIERARGDEQKV
jgi:hypothetical protein